MHTRFTRALVLCSFFLPLTASAGPLLPPVGPVVSTGKTLTEVQPRTPINAANTPGDSDSLFRITQPGSYYLTGNIAGVAGRHGIQIAASGVTIDLNGFALTGVVGSIAGIISEGGQSSIIIRNGTLASWGQSGIDLTSATGTIIESVSSRSNGSFGIRSGNYSVIRGCAASQNIDTGIVAFGSSVVESCQSGGNSGSGIVTGGASQISRCAVRDNTLIGINAGTGSTVTDCASSSNGDAGIFTGTSVTVIGCASTANGTNGIVASSRCLILNNVCSNNGIASTVGACILVTGNDNRIEGNNCTVSDFGIDVNAPGNIIIRNTCAGNTTDWDIAANNIYGPIVDRRIPTAVTSTPAVTGFGAASTLNSTDPNANFSY